MAYPIFCLYVRYWQPWLLLKCLAYLHGLSLQKRLLFAMKLFLWLQKAIVKTSFLTASLFHRQWLVKYQHICDGKMSLLKIPIIFVENVIFFGGKCSRLTFYDGIKMFVASKVLFMTTKQKTVETINTCDSFGTSKIQNIFFLWY